MHQFSPQFKDEETFSAAEMNAIVRDYARQVVGVYDYVQEMGVDVSFFVTTMRTPFTGMDVLPQDRWMIDRPRDRHCCREADETPVAAVLDAALRGRQRRRRRRPQCSRPAHGAARPGANDQVQTASLARRSPDGIWTVRRNAAGALEALFSDSSVSLSLACLRPDTAKLKLTFKDARIRSISSISGPRPSRPSASGLGERHVAITSVAAPGPAASRASPPCSTRATSRRCRAPTR